ncbi:hypothetical protein AAG570_002247 [Ranatra chinensis]|uniref:Uncharacterized protein n=1 Tax=Ranatra chinensis TaxID=642074 RepID=A0ABD0Y706_9HEMI
MNSGSLLILFAAVAVHYASTDELPPPDPPKPLSKDIGSYLLHLWANHVQIPPASCVRYFGLSIDKRVTWNPHRRLKRIDLNRKFGRNVLQRGSKLSLGNKLTTYNTILKPTWIYGAHALRHLLEPNIGHKKEVETNEHKTATTLQDPKHLEVQSAHRQKRGGHGGYGGYGGYGGGGYGGGGFGGAAVAEEEDTVVTEEADTEEVDTVVAEVDTEALAVTEGMVALEEVDTVALEEVDTVVLEEVDMVALAEVDMVVLDTGAEVVTVAKVVTEAARLDAEAVEAHGANPQVRQEAGRLSILI